MTRVVPMAAAVGTIKIDKPQIFKKVRLAQPYIDIHTSFHDITYHQMTTR